MKKLSEMKIAKEAILSSVEADAKGGNMWGTNTSYQGPDHPISLTTLLDGIDIGTDPYRGRLGGDYWVISDLMRDPYLGMISIKS
ncbi:MAG: hypothetical protein GX879_01090 [Bacteroidales bacterium]|nr:hypothetical protein [Bacteroidales bacterium]